MNMVHTEYSSAVWTWFIQNTVQQSEHCSYRIQFNSLNIVRTEYSSTVWTCFIQNTVQQSEHGSYRIQFNSLNMVNTEYSSTVWTWLLQNTVQQSEHGYYRIQFNSLNMVHTEYSSAVWTWLLQNTSPLSDRSSSGFTVPCIWETSLQRVFWLKWNNSYQRAAPLNQYQINNHQIARNIHYMFTEAHLGCQHSHKFPFNSALTHLRNSNQL